MKILLTHPGTQYSLALAEQLYRKGILHAFVTGLVFTTHPADWKRRWLEKLGLKKMIGRRLLKDIPPEKIVQHTGLELMALIRQQVLRQSNDQVFGYRNRRFQESISQKLIEESDLVIGFDTTSWILAERAKKAGKPFMLDVSIAHPLAKESIYQQLRQRFPAWSAELAPKQGRNIEWELAEMDAADHIVVASRFTQSTYQDHGIPENKISINAYGTNLGRFLPPSPGLKAEPGSRPLVFLFFGTISARKGFPWLCEVWEKFNTRYSNSRLIAAGYGQIPEGFQIPAGIELRGFVHPNDRLKLFHSADVFVFPSFFEGFAQVIIEAMACGLPVITTTHTAGPEIIESGKQGIIIEPGDDDALEYALTFFMEHQDQIAEMAISARQQVLPYTWNAYGDRWEAIARKVLLVKDEKTIVE